jgi:ABC-type Fe3+/spermidine/putrescine transport system ATPase subunit
MGMVFQSYGIWPHMTVFENVAYPLRIRKVDQATINDRVGKALELVGLESFHDRPAPMLSGGQQQRVAIARALVYRPKILLLDEPFSNLDAKLREHMRMELRELQRQLGVTILFVTHDQIEALTLSDRMAVMNRGKCEQLGTPRELYENPRTSFVQDFLGQTIAFDVIVAGRDDRGKVACTLDGTNHHVSLPIRPETPVSQGDRALFVFRPEYIQVFANGSAAHVTPQAGAYDAVFDATIKTLLFMGDRYEARIVVGSQEAIIYLPKDKEWTEGLPVRIALAHGKGRLWPK